jgi:hypothetical protein
VRQYVFLQNFRTDVVRGFSNFFFKKETGIVISGAAYLKARDPLTYKALGLLSDDASLATCDDLRSLFRHKEDCPLTVT